MVFDRLTTAAFSAIGNLKGGRKLKCFHRKLVRSRNFNTVITVGMLSGTKLGKKILIFMELPCSKSTVTFQDQLSALAQLPIGKKCDA